MLPITEETINQLSERCKALERQNAELMAKLRWFEEQFRLAQQRRYGSSSERTLKEQAQLVFNEGEVEAKPDEPEPTLETIIYTRQKKKGSRKVKLEDLPEETVEHRLPEEEQVCQCCGGPLHEMSTEERKELKIIAAQVKVIRHVRYVYGCRHCERYETHTPIVTAKMPAPVIPKSLASPSMLAYIMDEKFVQAMPLYRQEKRFQRLGVDLSRQNLANWMIQGSERWLAPLYERMHYHLLHQEILHADETTLQVLHEPDRAAQTTSYLWLYRTGRDGPQIVLFEYQPTRGAEHPRSFLSGFSGHLHADGYHAYEKIPGVTLVGCWSHARRKFDEALKAMPPAPRGKQPSAAEEGLKFCNRLFAIERDLKKATPEERYAHRLAESKPILDEFRQWLEEQTRYILPKSMLSTAVNYCLNQWPKLVAFLEDGRLELDNNRSERSIKPFVIGRKNWLFANTPRGARSSATIYSIIETAKENNLRPFAYLTYLFEQLPNIDITDPAALDELLPWSESLPANCRISRS